MRTVTALLLTMLASGMASAAPPEIENRGDGIYAQKLNKPFLGEMFYYVDARTELCFVAHYAGANPVLFTIPCANLAKRTEWREIITWVAGTEPALAPHSRAGGA